jgi:dTDP-4-amino-4,6-dideoxygalactose transaminase
MKIPFVDLAQQHAKLKEDISLVLENVIANSDFIRGSYMVPFEDEFGKLVGAKHCISCANGTDAIYIALKALGVGQGDEVITTSHTWISSSETITQAGAKVVFCDTYINTFNISVESIEEKINEKTKAIVVVHLAGQPAQIIKIKELADKYGLLIIEDCAQSHLAKIDNKTVGTIGDIATFSFYPGKNLGAMGDAGCIVTNNDDLADWMTLFARHGGKGDHLIEGINSRMDGIQAAILKVKLPFLKEWTIKRQIAADYYNELLSNIKDIITPYKDDNIEHVYHLYMIKVQNRDELKNYLRENGIPTVINYSKALPFYKAYDYLNHKREDFPNAYENQNKILSLPIYPEIEKVQQEYIVEKIINYYK